MKNKSILRISAFVAVAAFVLLLPAGPVSAAKPVELVLATATTGGTYYPVGVALSTLWSLKLRNEKPAAIKVNPITSAGSGENINMLKGKEVEMAILQGLFGKMAWRGTDIYEGKSMKELRSVTLLWPNVEHFVIYQDKVKTGTITDIKGLKFSIGRAGSGTERSGLTIMSGVGMGRDDVKAEYLGYFESSKAMKDKTIEGANLCAGPPVAAVTDLFATPGMKVQILEFTDEQLNAINEKTSYPGFKYKIAANTYPGQKKEIMTIAQPNFLGVRADVDAEIVYKLTKTIYENLPYLYAIHQATSFMKLELATSGLPAPLHPGALKYYREVGGVMIPDHLIPPGS
ncbi:MAG: TAXI family TRAP transporter solute-binding subunit [Deltaproteobacteria bacterium]|nr:MAG: TAXI family TRAP transporter solute-binding subunit [Deltaproteobacteria bacterium]